MSQPTVLNVAAEAEEAEFRLASIGELAGVYEAEKEARAQERKDALPWSKARRMRAL